MSESALTPSTDWAEHVREWEEQWHKQLTDDLLDIQNRFNHKYGPGRTLHRRQIAGVTGSLSINPDLPEYLRHGVFLSGASYDCVIRLSDAGWAINPDAVPDIHGFALSLRGISGPGALGFDTDRQDFLFTERSSFGFPTSREFGAVVKYGSQGQAALGKHFISEYGPIQGPLIAAKLAASAAKPFLGFATSTFNSLVAIQVGPYAARVQLQPKQRDRNLKAIINYTDDVKNRLRTSSLSYDLQLQFFADEQRTPIEDGSVEWSAKDSPYLTVGTLTIPQQDCDSPQGLELSEAVERDRFDPWAALDVHRPLGEIMRARKATYFASVKNREVPGE